MVCRLRYVARVRAELTDHFLCAFDDCLSSGIAEHAAVEHAQHRLGSADELFEAIVSRREHDSFVHRHPFVTFALLPVPLAIVLACTIAFVGRFTYHYVLERFQLNYLDSTVYAVVDQSFKVAVYGLTPAIALYFCRLGTMYRCPISFAFISCLTLALAGGVLKLDLVQCLLSGSVKYFQRTVGTQQDSACRWPSSRYTHRFASPGTAGACRSCTRDKSAEERNETEHRCSSPTPQQHCHAEVLRSI